MRDFMTPNSVFYLRTDVYDDYKEYKDDFKRVIKEREENRIPFFHRSPQIHYRHTLVSFMRKCCAEKALSYSCLHLAVYLLDIFMDNYNILPEKLLLVANVCLILAAKIEENSINIPKFSELNALIDNKYLIKDYVDVEKLVLQHFQFYLNFPTAAHYVFYYMQEFLTYEDLNGERNFRSLFFEMRDAVMGYLDLITESVHYLHDYKPSLLAAVIIAASRVSVELPCWTQVLEKFTGYDVGDIVNPVQFLLP